jgi:hypothetical protein
MVPRRLFERTVGGTSTSNRRENGAIGPGLWVRCGLVLGLRQREARVWTRGTINHSTIDRPPD